MEAKESDGNSKPTEIADLLSLVGKFLQDIAAYGTAETLYKKALALSEQIYAHDPDHPDIAQKLDGKALP